MISLKQTLRDHPIMRCPKNKQKTDRWTPNAEVWFQQSCCYAPLLKSHFGMDYPATCEFAAYALKHS